MYVEGFVFINTSALKYTSICDDTMTQIESDNDRILILILVFHIQLLFVIQALHTQIVYLFNIRNLIYIEVDFNLFLSCILQIREISSLHVLYN